MPNARGGRRGANSTPRMYCPGRREIGKLIAAIREPTEPQQARILDEEVSEADTISEEPEDEVLGSAPNLEGVIADRNLPSNVDDYAAAMGITSAPRRSWSNLSAHQSIILTRSSQNSARA